MFTNAEKWGLRIGMGWWAVTGYYFSSLSKWSFFFLALSTLYTAIYLCLLKGEDAPEG
jgi:uncharacterized membrane protein YfhO